MRFRIIPTLFSIATALCAADSGGLPREMTGERPGFTEPTDVLPPGMMQFEMGLRLSRRQTDSGMSRDFAGPLLMMRVALTRFAEIRLATDGFTRRAEYDQGLRALHAGMSDIVAGFEAHVMDEHGWRPAILGHHEPFDACGGEPFFKRRP